MGSAEASEVLKRWELLQIDDRVAIGGMVSIAGRAVATARLPAIIYACHVVAKTSQGCTGAVRKMARPRQFVHGSFDHSLSDGSLKLIPAAPARRRCEGASVVGRKDNWSDRHHHLPAGRRATPRARTRSAPPRRPMRLGPAMAAEGNGLPSRRSGRAPWATARAPWRRRPPPAAPRPGPWRDRQDGCRRADSGRDRVSRRGPTSTWDKCWAPHGQTG